MYVIPERLAAACHDNASRWEWLRRLPDVLHNLQKRWSIQLGSPFESGSCAWVAPVLNHDTAAVLKLGLPHMEGDGEIEGLRFWDGNPTVKLLKADKDLNAMLLERCQPGTSLRELPEAEQDVVIAGLLRNLWRPPKTPHSFRPLSAMTKYWSDETCEQEEHWPDRALVSDGLQLFEELSNPSPDEVLLATDLHAGNVLRAQRAPWLVIDPKPFSGDPAYDATQHLFNCQERLRSDPSGTIRRLAQLLGLDAERIRLWTFARAAVQAGISWQDSRWLQVALDLRS